MDIIALPTLAPAADEAPAEAIDFTDPSRPMFGGAIGTTP